MLTVIITLIIIISLFWLIQPIISKRQESVITDDLIQDASDQLRRSRERIYEEIRVLQQEYFLGHLSEGTYQSQLSKSRFQAAGLLREQEQIKKTLTEVEKDVEASLLEIKDPTDSEGKVQA